MLQCYSVVTLQRNIEGEMISLLNEKRKKNPLQGHLRMIELRKKICFESFFN